MLHSGVRSYCWFEINSNNTFRQVIHNQVIPLLCCWSLGSFGRWTHLMQACFSQFAYSCCMWVKHNFSSNANASTLKPGIPPSLCAGKENWMDNSTGALMSLAHSGGSSGAPRRGCPWRGCLSAVGLSLIYGGRHWLAGRAGGAQAPSLSQPRLKANYIFISLWSGWTRTELWSEPDWHGSDSFI